MTRSQARLLLILLLATLAPATALAQQRECVVLLHGLSRTDFSMQPLETALEQSGYSVANIGYDSRRHRIEELAATTVERGTELCRALQAERIHFATHSMGGILVRYYLTGHDIDDLGRVVMMAPPNGGSEIIDVFGEWPGFELISGEPARQLGTGGSSLPHQLGPVDFDLGVIAGTRSLNPLTSMTLPDEDDGKVSVEKTKVAGMHDFIALPYTHTFIMARQEAIEQVIHFIGNGRFHRPDRRADAGF